MIFADESIQPALGYLCVGFAYCNAAPDEFVSQALINAGLDPGRDEYKSGYRMHGSSSRHALRESIYALVLQRCRVAVYIAPLEERPALLGSVAEVGRHIVMANALSTPQKLFVDEGIDGKPFNDPILQVVPGCDSRTVPGIQLADCVAYHCSYLLRCAIRDERKSVLMPEDVPHPLAGEEVDLDWIFRTDFRRNFFVESRDIDSIRGDDWFFTASGYGAFFSPALGADIRDLAEQTFGAMYLGCVL